MNRIDRLTGIILQLQSHRGITAADIAAHWEVSVRTVYRDLAALGEAGVPIAADPGAGYKLMDGYHMPPVMFTEDEAAALFVSGKVTDQVADDSLRRSLRSALLKIRSVLPDERREYLARLQQSVGVWIRSPTLAPSMEGLMPIQDAILRRRCIALRYDAGGRGEITSRTVEPVGLVFYGRRWHLIAFCRLRQDFRDFRLDRVAGWEVLVETYDGHADFSVERFLDEAIRCDELIPATFAVERSALDRLRAEMPSTPGREEVLPDGWVRVEMLAFSLEWLAGRLLGFGAAVEVERPAELRNRLRDAAQAVAAKYSEEPAK